MKGKENEVEIRGDSQGGGKGKKSTWIGYGKIRIDGQWWRWDEEEKVLRDE
jgi:hypothetical protein